MTETKTLMDSFFFLCAGRDRKQENERSIEGGTAFVCLFLYNPKNLKPRIGFCLWATKAHDGPVKE